MVSYSRPQFKTKFVEKKISITFKVENNQQNISKKIKIKVTFLSNAGLIVQLPSLTDYLNINNCQSYDWVLPFCFCKLYYAFSKKNTTHTHMHT